jgi:hypothetical protein
MICVRPFDQASAYSQCDGIYFLNDATDPDLPANNFPSKVSSF